MENRLIKFILGSLLFFSVSLYADEEWWVEPPQIQPGVYNTSISWGQVYNEILEGNYNFAFSLVYDPLTEMYRFKKESIERNPIPYLYEASIAMAKALKEILDDTSKSKDEQKQKFFLFMTKRSILVVLSSKIN